MEFIERFAKWQNFVHYILLTLGLYVVFDMLMQRYPGLEPTKIAAALFLSLLILDFVIHFTFSILPEPLRWED